VSKVHDESKDKGGGEGKSKDENKGESRVRMA
jgi:hypothetical protein